MDGKSSCSRSMSKKAPAPIVTKQLGPKAKLEMDGKKSNDMIVGREAPAPILTEQLGPKANCLCSPTTHAGSFRCRHHRSGMARSSQSYSSYLSEIANKPVSETQNVSP